MTFADCCLLCGPESKQTVSSKFKLFAFMPESCIKNFALLRCASWLCWLQTTSHNAHWFWCDVTMHAWFWCEGMPAWLRTWAYFRHPCVWITVIPVLTAHRASTARCDVIKKVLRAYRSPVLFFAFMEESDMAVSLLNVGYILYM